MLSTINIATMDVHILMSIVNMKLRNEFSSITSLCAGFELEEQYLLDNLKKGDYVYDLELNKFRHINI